MMAWLTLFSFSFVHARSLESMALSRLAAARNSHELARLHAEFENLSVSIRACHIQLQEKQVPLACYEALHLAKGWPEVPDDLLDEAELDQRCFRAAHELMVDDADSQPASRPCRERIARARKIRAYRDSDREPDSWPVD